MNTIPRRARIVLVALALPAAVLTGCNLFSIIDSPSGDAQVLSAARAALDRGDFEEARSLYAKLGSSLAEVKASELAFTTLAEYGAGMREFMGAFGGGGSGEAFNELAESLVPRKGEAARKAIYSAYLQTENITTNTQLRGLVRFVSATALVSEILAEQAAAAGSATQLDRGDLVSSASCYNLTSVTCLGAGACNATAGLTDTGAAFSITASPSATAFDGATPDLSMLNAAMKAINFGLNELQATGDFSSGTGGTTDDFTDVAYAASKECYRWQLLQNGIGRP